MEKIRSMTLALSVVLAVSGCAKVTEAYNTVTNFTVPAKTIRVAVSGFNIAKATATNYIRYCTPKVQPKGCDNNLIKAQLIPTMNAGTIARNALLEFVDNNPGALGPVGTYNALVAATTTINQMKLEYGK